MGVFDSGRSTVSFRKELLNAEGEPRYPDQRRGGVNIDSLDDVPTLNYWLDTAPFTLTDLTQIFTLLAPVDADEARIFLAEIHYYFMTKRSKTDRSHIEALFGGGRIPFEPFFFAVKCLIQGHVSSTVRTSCSVRDSLLPPLTQRVTSVDFCADSLCRVGIAV